MAWNLAGGYQKPLSKVLEIHTNTLQACIDVYLDRGDGRPDAELPRYRHPN
ncbi:MAG: hypothetical protein ACT4QA_04540 [Panacagrimonas sp.]